MKRHPALREFSDDHHQGLVNARRLKKAGGTRGGAGSSDAARSFLEFWHAETAPHFRKEEEVLLPVLARHGGDLEAEPVALMLAQHASIRGFAMQLGDELDRKEVREETLRALGEQLEAHIRLEERVVFPMIERFLSEDALKEVALRLAAFEGGTPPERRTATGE